MRKSILLFFMMAMCSGVFAQKIAHVHPSKIMEDMQDYKDAMKDIQNMQTDAFKRLSKMDSTYKALVADYQANSADWTDIKKKIVEQDIVDLEQRYPKAEQEEQQKIQTKQQQYMALISEKIQTAIKQVGEAGQYTYVIDGTALHYTNGGNDITDEVRKKLGLEPLSTN